MVIADLLGRLPYALILALAATGIALAAGAGNLMKRVAGLCVLWGALALFYALTGVLVEGDAPILSANAKAYSNPLPQALILGAMVAGAASIALALAIVVRIKESYGGIEAADIAAADEAQAEAEAP